MSTQELKVEITKLLQDCNNEPTLQKIFALLLENEKRIDAELMKKILEEDYELFRRLADS